MSNYLKTMDLSSIHSYEEEEDKIGKQQKRVENSYGSCVFKVNKSFGEDDIKGNNNLLYSLKTETNINCDLNPGSLFQGVVSLDLENDSLEERSFLGFSTFRKAIDLSIHNRTDDKVRKTIFDDAEYFAKNYLYKLLPITFENVDEAIIHKEHNYCHLALSSGSEAEGDCSRTMDYTQIKEKNYKKRKPKFRQAESKARCGREEDNIASCFQNGDASEKKMTGSSDSTINVQILHSEPAIPVQPLDLRSPLVQEEKTDHSLREHQTSIVNKYNIQKKENEMKLKRGSIKVTITRPDEKENYQPCDLFLSDIARLVPRLIEKDCSEIDILDRTYNSNDSIRKHRLYYIISEPTWRLFQSTSERVILTNDPTLGELARKSTEKVERPTFLVFDQFSLAKCLADYCKETGGFFEYTCVEESKEIFATDETTLEKEKNGSEKEKNESQISKEKSVTKEESDEVSDKEVVKTLIVEKVTQERKNFKDDHCENQTGEEVALCKVDERDVEDSEGKENCLCSLESRAAKGETKNDFFNGKSISNERTEAYYEEKEVKGSEIKEKLGNKNESKLCSMDSNDRSYGVVSTKEISSSMNDEAKSEINKIKIEKKKVRDAKMSGVLQKTEVRKREIVTKQSNFFQAKGSQGGQFKKNLMTRSSQKESKVEKIKFKYHVRTRSKSMFESEYPSKIVTSQNSDKSIELAGRKRKKLASGEASSKAETPKKKKQEKAESFKRRTRSETLDEVRNKINSVSKKTIHKKEMHSEVSGQSIKRREKRKAERQEGAKEKGNEMRSDRLRARREAQGGRQVLKITMVKGKTKSKIR